MRALAVLLVLAPVGAGAQTVDELRASCEPFLTVVYEGCVIENYARCADGSSFVEQFELGEDLFVSLTDSEGNGLFAYAPATGEGILSVTSGPDPISLTELLENGRDVFRQSAQMRMLFADSWEISVDGTYELDGGTIVIDGVSLLTGEVAVAAEVFKDNPERMNHFAEIFVDPQLGLIFEGDNTQTMFGGTMFEAITPQRFISPGEPDFFSTDHDTLCAPTLSKEAPSP